MKDCPKCQTTCADTTARCTKCGASLTMVQPGTSRFHAPAVASGPPGTARLAASAGGPASAPASSSQPTSGWEGLSRPLGYAVAAVAGALASLLWVAISRAADSRLSFLVIGVGLAVGCGVGWSIRDRRLPIDGVVAGALTLCGLFLAKAVLTGLMLADMREEVITQMQQDDAMIARLCAEVPATGMEDGEFDSADEAKAGQHGEEPEVWAEARRRWEAMAPAQREGQREKAAREVTEGFAEIEGAWLGLGAFFGSLTGIGSTLVALGIAWSLGSGINRKS